MMKFAPTALLATTALLLSACSPAANTAEAAPAMAEKAVGADLSALPSGTYKSEQGHAYVAFQYWHQDYSRPIIRWGTTDATVVFDNENPENSTLTVRLPTADIDTGVPAWDDHIKKEGFFDVENYPEVTFVSTNVEQLASGHGTVTGNLTIKDVTRPFTLTGTINKVGQHFRNGKDMFGVSATGSLKRSDFNVDKYSPSADDIEIVIEVEFQKED
jgi:polyisoprenoid-binding protein YceI